MKKIFLAWLPVGVGVTAICAIVLVAVQQNYRQSLNDPQVQMAEDAAAAITSGKELDQVVPTNIVDIETSLSPWLAVYTQSGVPLLSSGKLNGEVPQLPSGVFDTDTWHRYAEDGLALPIPANEDRVTWQPSAGVRQALVIVHYDSPNGIGFVVAGRNMREVENREGVLVELMALGWAATIIATFLAQIFAAYAQ